MRAPAACLLAAVACSCGARAVPAPPLRLHVDAPAVIELLPGTLPVARAALDGRDNLRFVVDTGADASSILRPWAEELGLPILPFEGTVTGSNGLTVPVTSWTYVRLLRLGSARVEHLSLLVLEPGFEEQGWCGILGQDLLGELPVIVDRQRDRLHLLPPAWGRTEIEAYVAQAALGSGAWAIVEASFEPGVFLDLSAGGAQHRIRVDTGASISAFPRPILQALGLDALEDAAVRGVTGERLAGVHGPVKVDLFGLIVEGSFHDTPLDHGLLGMDVLGQLVLVHDAPSGDIWLHKRSDEPPGESR